MAPQTFPERKNPNLFSGIYIVIPNVKIPNPSLVLSPSPSFTEKFGNIKFGPKNSGMLHSGFLPFSGFGILLLGLLHSGKVRGAENLPRVRDHFSKTSFSAESFSSPRSCRSPSQPILALSEAGTLRLRRSQACHGTRRGHLQKKVPAGSTSSSLKMYLHWILVVARTTTDNEMGASNLLSTRRKWRGLKNVFSLVI